MKRGSSSKLRLLTARAIVGISARATAAHTTHGHITRSARTFTGPILTRPVPLGEGGGLVSTEEPNLPRHGRGDTTRHQHGARLPLTGHEGLLSRHDHEPGT